MTSEAEQKLINRGWPIDAVDFGRHDEPDVGGCVVVRHAGEGVEAQIVVRPSLTDDERASFAVWALQMLTHFEEHGPEFDGWQKRSDEGWQLWVRKHQFPSLD